MLAKRRRAAGAFSRLTVPLRLLALVAVTVGLAGFDTCKGRKKPTTGRIEVSTQPGGYPISIDGQPAGETTDHVRAIELDPGRHTVEIIFPQDRRWSNTFDIVADDKKCIALTYRSQTIQIPPGVQSGRKAETVEPGKDSPTGVVRPSLLTLEADTQVVTLCPEAGASANPRVRLKVSVGSPEGNLLQYKWNVSGGRIEGDGADVVWDLSGVQPGTYNAAVKVESKTGEVTVFTSTHVVVRECPASSGQSQPETVDVGVVTGTIADCGEIALPEGGFFPRTTPTPKPKKKR